MLGLKVKGEPKPFLGLDNAKSLVALAQAAVTEIHPWGSKKNEPDIPERIIIDLDPAPDVDFKRVMEAAHEVRKRFSALGLVPFVKTTGGKGLHVVVPVKGTPKIPVSWAEAKAFAKAVALSMEQDARERYTTEIAKKARTGKIFVDYLRNDRTSTGVAPWSPRAREGAPVAVPLTWTEIKPGLDPKAFTLATAGKFLKKADPWKNIAGKARSLDAAMKKLMKNV
jgi:bifunctional non-homologous end joining protein LigD